MNKTLKLISILALALIVNTAAVQAAPDFSRPMPEEHMDGQGFPPPLPSGTELKKHRPPSHEEFEKRLNLTEEQKALAKAQREASIEKIKPIVEQIKAKKAEIEAVQKTRMAQRAIDERVAELQGEIRELRKQAHEIRKENMKAFEATLSEEQKKELQKMKEEGRKRFEEHRKNHVRQ